MKMYRGRVRNDRNDRQRLISQIVGYVFLLAAMLMTLIVLSIVGAM